MLPGERDVAGLRCSGVLAILSEYLDGDLPESQARHVAAHVAACTVCEQFGGRFAQAIHSLRLSLTDPEALPEDVADRLRARLAVR